MVAQLAICCTMLKRFPHTQIVPVEGYCHVKFNSNQTLRRKSNGPMAQWTPLHAQRGQTTEPRGRGGAEVTSISTLLIFFFHSFPMHWNHKILFLKGPGQPDLCLFLRKVAHYILFGHVEAKEISDTKKDERKYFLGTQRKFKQYDFT